MIPSHFGDRILSKLCWKIEEWIPTNCELTILTVTASKITNKMKKRPRPTPTPHAQHQRNE